MPRASLAHGAAHIGERDKLITIERLREEAVESNFPKEDWILPFTMWASREYALLDEKPQDSQQIASAIMRWEVPYTPLLDPDLVDVPNKRRIKYYGRIHNIIAAEMRPRSSGMSIVLTTDAKAG